MKICHCVKLTDEEVKAFNIVCNVLDEMEDDSILVQSFSPDCDVSFGDICYWLNEVTNFIRNFDN